MCHAHNEQQEKRPDSITESGRFVLHKPSAFFFRKPVISLNQQKAQKKRTKLLQLKTPVNLFPVNDLRGLCANCFIFLVTIFCYLNGKHRGAQVNRSLNSVQPLVVMATAAAMPA
ncbi:hypothetical protein [Terracidiphilus sp.]|uniref:hypothetical protein n=1 Tax=Terracidiphilus sp. TaxID=1964191 RepID=UPI003C20EDC9